MSEYLSAPIKVSYDVTHRCNLQCQHCRILNSTIAPEELSIVKVKQFVDELSAMKVFVLGISGGEPFIRSDFIDIIKYATKSDVGRIFVSTNFTLINDDILNELSNLKDKLAFKVSIDSIGVYHDSIRGMPGAFDRTVEGIKLAVSHGFRVQVTTTLMQFNYKDIIEIIEFVKSLGVKKHRIIEIIPLGKASFDLVLSDESRRSVWLMFEQNKKRLVQDGLDVTLDMPFVGRSFSEFTCQAGRSECGILPDGSVVGCRLLPNITTGNIKDRAFREIWDDAKSFTFFRELTPDSIKGNCSDCEYGRSCRGGCRAYAIAVYNDFYMPDPRCLLV